MKEINLVMLKQMTLELKFVVANISSALAAISDSLAS